MEDLKISDTPPEVDDMGGIDSAKKPEKAHPKKSSMAKKGQKRRKRDLEKRIRKKVSFEEKAFRVIESLMETQANSDKNLMEAGQHIDQTMYEDVVEERFIACVCGYPACGNKLCAVPKQKYHISTQSNKVYDISDRKRYCSGVCYKASKFFSRQISTSPVWSRENEEPVKFKLLDTHTQNKGLAGECVLDHPAAEIRKELAQLERIDRLSETKPRESLTEEPPGESDVTTMDDVAKQLIDLHLLNEDEFRGKPTTSEVGIDKSDNPGPVVEGSLSTSAATDSDSVLQGEIKVEQDSDQIRATDSYSDPNMDRRRNHGDHSQHQGISTRQYKHEISGLDPSYCNRKSSDKSQGHINRATYYGFDETQESLKAAVCQEITRCVVHHKSQHDNVDHQESIHMTNKSGLSDSPTVLDQKTQTTLTKTVYKRTALQNLCQAGFLKEPLTIGNSREIRMQPLYNSDVGGSVRNTNINNKQNQTQSRTEYLMDLIDKREVLKSQLEGTDNSGLSGKSSDNKSKFPSRVNQSIHVENQQSDHSDRQNLSRSGNRDILENINRVSQQSSGIGILDSDDEEVSALTDGVTTTLKLRTMEPSLGSELNKDGLDKNGGSTLSNAEGGSQNEPGVLKKVTAPVVLSPLDLIGQILLEWKTVETCRYLKGDDRTDEKAVFDRKYQALSRKVDTQIREHSHLLGEGTSYSEPTKKVPEFSQLVKETKVENLEVKEVITQPESANAKDTRPTEGDTKQSVWKKKKKLFDHEESEVSVYDRDELVTETGVYLPYIDSYSQTAIRRRIVLDRLSRVLPDLMGQLKMSVRDISTELQHLVNTFNLTSKNIVLKPAEWTFMGFMVLKLLSRRVKRLKEAFRQDYAVHFFNTVLHGINADTAKVKAIVRAMTKL